MFKKSLVAVAVLGAVAFSAQAADVQLYGRIDTGVRYTNIDADVPIRMMSPSSKCPLATPRATALV